MFLFDSVKKTFFIIVLLAITPAALILVYSGLQDVERSRRGMADEAREYVRSLSFRQQSITENIRAMLLASSLLDEVRQQDIPMARALFRAMLHKNSRYSTLGLTAVDGTRLILVRHATQGLASATQRSGEAKPAFITNVDSLNTQLARQAFDAHRIAFSPIVSHQGYTAPHMHFAYPVYTDEQKPAAAITGAVTPDAYAIPSNMLDLPQGASVYILDGAGSLLLPSLAEPRTEQNQSPPMQVYAAGTPFATITPFWTSRHDPRAIEGSFRHAGASGKEELFTYRNLFLPGSDSPYMTVLLVMPYDVLFSSENTDVFTRIGLLVLTFVAAFMVYKLFSGISIGEPLKVVLNSAARLRRGDLTARADTSHLSGEMKVLGERFNNMAEAIEGRERELLIAKQASDAHNVAKGHFLAAMSHAIRTPMNSVIGVAYLLMKTSLTEKQHSYVQKIYIAANALLGIINDILDFSNIETGRFTIDRVPFSLGETLQGVMTLCEQKAEERHIQLDMQVEDDVPQSLVGDPLRLTQVLTNLVTNAVKFTEFGSVVVRCGLAAEEKFSTANMDGVIRPCDTFGENDTQPDGIAQKKNAAVSVSDENTIRLSFTVTDTGIGMTCEQLETVFTAFTQADRSINRRYGGTGLGLAISQRLVALMGGDIDAASEYGKGTTMHFTACFGIGKAKQPGADTRQSSDTLPHAHADKQDGSHNQHDGRWDATIKDSLRGLNILLVEDNPVNQEITAELLLEAGAEIQIVDDGSRAVFLLGLPGVEKTFDLILMDVNMPVMDGYEATKRLRAMGITLPIIAMTAHAMSEERDYCLACGMEDHIAKPLEVERFFETIKQYVTAKRDV